MCDWCGFDPCDTLPAGCVIGVGSIPVVAVPAGCVIGWGSIPVVEHQYNKKLVNIFKEGKKERRMELKVKHYSFKSDALLEKHVVVFLEI